MTIMNMIRDYLLTCDTECPDIKGTQPRTASAIHETKIINLLKTKYPKNIIEGAG